MAYTVSKKVTVMGDQRVSFLNITADAATQTVETGLKKVNAFAVGKQSGASGWAIYANSNASGVESMGVIGISGAVSGDQAFVIVYGE